MKWQILTGQPSVCFLLLHVTISSAAMPPYFHERLDSTNYQVDQQPAEFHNRTADAIKAVRQLLNFDNGVSTFCTNLLQLVLTVLGLPMPQSMGDASAMLRKSLSSGMQFLTTSSTSPAGPILKLFNSSYKFIQNVPAIN